MEKEVGFGRTDPEVVPGVTKDVFQEEVKRLLKELEDNGYIHPITPEDPDGLRILRAWGARERVPIEEVADFFEQRLTDKGRNFLEETAEKGDLETPLGFLNALERAVSLSRNSMKEIRETKPQESTAYQESIAEDEVTKQFTMGEATTGKVPLRAWLLNPIAAAKLLGAIAEQATTQANLRRKASETARWLAEVTANDAKRDVLLTRVEELEQALGPYLEQFCQERGQPVPEKGTLTRMALLLRVNSEMGALQMREREIAKKGEMLVATQVAIQSEKANNQMLAQELPFVIESAREVNALKEQLITEKLRHLGATLTASISGAIVGSIGGLLAGVGNAVSTLVEEHPKVTISLGAGLATFILQTVSYPGVLSADLLQTFAIKGALVAGVTAIATGIGAGLVARVAKKRDSRNLAKGGAETLRVA